MGKRTKETETPTAGNDKKTKKQKKDAANPVEAATTSGLFSLVKNVKDAELDDIFSKSSVYASAPTPVQANVASSSKSATKTAAVAEVSDGEAELESEEGHGESDNDEEDGSDADTDVASEDEEAEGSEEEDLSEGEDLDIDDVNASDLDSEAGPSKPLLRDYSAPIDESESELEEEEDTDIPANLTHETLKITSPKPKPCSSTTRYIPPGETTQDRNLRTIFLGNLPISLTTTKSQQSQLRAHLLTYAPTAKIESIRFRSIPFAKPTAGLGGGDAEEEGKRLKREKERARVWREGQEVLKGGDEKAKEEIDKSKSYIDSKGKRKVAFIKKEFHAEAGSCNAYVVFAHPHPDRPSNVAPILDPYEAAKRCLAANGSTLLNNTIRVDAVTKTSQGIAPSASTKKGEGWVPVNTDAKKSLFVGGLDYAVKEEDLRVLFETLVTGEKGEKVGGIGKWVESVRIVRDKETQLGKGFGYVHFVDGSCVDEMLAIDGKKLKLAKRPIRVQRCKTLPTSTPKPKPTTSKPTANSKFSSTKYPSKTPTLPKRRLPTGPLPKGNPALGEQIRGLSKDERKVFKAGDEDRIARRMAKKAKKAAEGVRGSKGKEVGAVKLWGERRGKKFDASKKGAKKGRGRSDAAVAKMKGARV